jgi:hypothetical protein
MADAFTSRPTKLIALALLIAFGVSSLAAAQQYQTKPIDDKARLLGPIAQNCVKDPARYATDKARFDEYFQKYFFPAMTRYRPNDLAELGKMREELLGRYLWASRDEKLQNDLTELAFTELQPVGRSGKFHPAVRYNAILVLGMLDTTYAIQGGPNNRPPVPFKKGTAELTLIVNTAADGKPVPPFLVVGALVGLQRHAQFHDKLDKSTVDAMSATALKLAAKDEPLPEVDAKVAEWIRIQAATVLTRIGSPGPNGEVQALLTKMISGQTVPKMPLDARCQIAALLAQMKYQGVQVDGKATAEALLQLALEVGDDEAKEAKAFEDMQVEGSGFGGGYGGAPRGKGRMRFDEESTQWEYDARILLARLGDLSSGLTAAKVIAPADKQPVFDAVLAAIDPAMAAAESTDTIDLEVAGKVVEMAAQIRAAVKPGSAPAEEADAGAIF